MRRATVDDAEALLRQARAAMSAFADFAPPGWTLDRFAPEEHLARIRSTLENPDAVVEVAGDGAGHFAWRPEPDRAHLLALFVEPEAWGTGLAAQLHARALETMSERGFTEAGLYTPAGNARARRFYEREGWWPHGEPFFSDSFGLDVVEYRRRIEPALGELVERLRRREDCTVHRPAGPMPVALDLPEDVERLYALCGGMLLGRPEGSPWRVVGPEGLVTAAERLLAPEDAAQVLTDFPEDVASTTVVFADQGGASTDEHVLLDLHPARRGRFYDAFWDRFGVAGSMPVIATSVAGALAWLLNGPPPGAPAADAYDDGG